MDVIKNIIFICGASHSEWCWDEYFVRYFRERGYKTYIHVLSQGASNVDESISKLNNVLTKINSEFIIITHSIGNLILNEYLNKNELIPSAMILLSPYPNKHRFLNAIKISYRYYSQSKKQLFFSGRVKEPEKYIKKMTTESTSIRLLALTYSKLSISELGIPTLIIGSQNDKCIPVKSLMHTMRAYNATLKIYNDLCHDCMLDPDWEKVAEDIYIFLKDCHSKK